MSIRNTNKKSRQLRRRLTTKKYQTNEIKLIFLRCAEFQAEFVERLTHIDDAQRHSPRLAVYKKVLYSLRQKIIIIMLCPS